MHAFSGCKVATFFMAQPLLLALVVFSDCLASRILLQAKSSTQGDIEVNLLVPARSFNRDKGVGEHCCGAIFASQAILISQFKRIIEDVNNAEPAILPGNLKIGYEIIDTCSSEDYAVSQILSWLEKRKKKARPPIAFVVGASFSRITQRVAPILASFRIPLVDYGATSPALSDRSLFKLYARVTPSDLYLTQAISELVVHLQWRCVHVLYSQGAYGENGGEAVAQHLLNKGVCIAGSEPIALPLTRTSEEAFDGALENMLRFPNIRPVICFCESTSISGLLDAMIRSQNRNRPNNFFLVAGDFWGSEMTLANQQDAAEWSITLKPKTSAGRMLSPRNDRNNADLESWISAKIQQGMNEKSDPWLNEYLESQKIPCSLNSSSNIRPCDNEALNHIEYPMSDRLSPISNAIYAGVFGIKAFFDYQCSVDSSKCNKPEALNDGPGLYNFIVKSTFPQEDGNRFAFYGNGDGNPQYEIHQFLNSEGYKLIGQWNPDSGLSLNNNAFLQPYGSDFSKSCPRGLCKTNCTPSKIIKKSVGFDDDITVPCFDEEQHEEKSDDDIAYPILVAILSVLLALAIAAIIFLFVRRKTAGGQKGTNGGNIESYKTRAMKYLEGILSNPNFKFAPAEKDELRQLFQAAVIDSTRILHMSEELVGKGCKGVVNKGFYETSKGLDTVALKSLREESPAEVVDFIRESAMMYSFNHSNILKLIGICVSPTNQLLIVAPFMPDGDLRNFLVKNGHALRDDDRLNFITQICSAMVYLSSKNCIHRDLACRNILIELLPYMTLLKLSDFGLTRYLSESEYYKPADRNRSIPIRWWPPESLHEGFLFEERSDVWSFGIVCWEIYSNGLRPYDELTNMEVYDFVVKGGHPEQPEDCGTEIYMDLMKRCWNSYRPLRPRFNDILTRLRMDKQYRISGRTSNNHSGSNGTPPLSPVDPNAYMQATKNSYSNNAFTDIQSVPNGIQL